MSGVLRLLEAHGRLWTLLERRDNDADQDAPFNRATFPCLRRAVGLHVSHAASSLLGSSGSGKMLVVSDRKQSKGRALKQTLIPFKAVLG